MVEDEDQPSARLTVGVDLDGVLGDQIKDVLPRIKARLGIDLRYEQISEFRLRVGSSDLAREILLALEDPGYISNMPVHLGAAELVRQLSSRYRVIVITARPAASREVTEQWLRAQAFAFDSVIYADGSKSLYGADVLIDDYTGNVLDFVSSTNGIGVLVDRPWNRRDRAQLEPWLAAKRVFVADELAEIAARLDALLEEGWRDRCRPPRPMRDSGGLQVTV